MGIGELGVSSPKTLWRLAEALALVLLVVSNVVIGFRVAQAATVGQVVALHARLLRAQKEPAAAELSTRFQQALGTYLEERTPSDPNQRAAFLDNVEYMIASDLSSLDAMIRQPPNRPASKNSSAFNDHLDAVAFFTAAGERVISKSLAEGWSRRPSDDPRKADERTDWAANKALYLEYRQNDSLLWGDKKTFGEWQAKATDQAAVWIDNLGGRLSQIYGDPVLEFAHDPGLIADLARVQYLMIGEVTKNGVQELAGLGLLNPLATELAKDNDAKNAASANQQLDTALWQTEAGFGFRAGDVMPTGILSAEEFFQIIAAGYLPNDVGADLVHGSLTHRLQWNMLMTDFEQNPEAWHYPPLEVLARIGEFDLRRQNLNEEKRFGFERSFSLWAQLFDQQGLRLEDAEFSRPDSMETILGRSETLRPILDRVATISKERLREGIDLLTAALDPKTVWQKGEWRPDAAAMKARIAQGVDRTIIADELYRERFFDQAKKNGYKIVTNKNGQATNLLIRNTDNFTPEPNLAEITRQRTKYAAELAPAVVSERTASTRDERVRLRPGDAIATSSTAKPRARREDIFRDRPEDSEALKQREARRRSRENDDPDRDFISSSDHDADRNFTNKKNAPANKTTERSDSAASMISTSTAEASTVRKQQRRGVDAASESRRNESTAENAEAMRSAQNTPRLERRAESTATAQAGNASRDDFRRSSRDTVESGSSRTRSVESPRREGRVLELAR
jgi:Family of unknown function (DUF5636)